MDIRYKLYPYPVLAYYSDDYIKSEFNTEISIKKVGYDINVEFKSTLINNELKNLIKNGHANFVYHLECSQTSFRKVVVTNEEEEEYLISDKEVCGKLQICPFIVAAEDIMDYSSTDFHSDYSGSSFNIEKGCVLAVGRQVNAEITKEIEDIAKTPSVFSIIKNADPNIKEMIIGIDGQKIIIKLPSDDYYSYKQLDKSPETHSILNSITIVPALIYALEELKGRSIEEREELSECSWYRAVRKALASKFDIDIESEDFEQENLVILAQRLINDPLADAFKVLCDGFGTAGGDEE